jgi:hypothetical protein
MVWGISLGRAFCVFHAYTPEWARRQGVRTKINEAIFKDYDVVETGESTKEGKSFMRATGYKFDKKKRVWTKKVGGSQ